MADKFGPIFEAISKKNADAYEAGNVDAAAEMYDDHAVVIDKKNQKSFFGTEQIKQMIEGYVKMGKCDFKLTRKDIHDVGGERFYVDADFESTIVSSGVEMKGNFHQLYHNKDGKWKVVYECFEMQ